MLLIGYLYGIKSERRLVEEVQLNIAYRWFCGLDFSDNVPEHSLFSQNRRRRFHNNTLFQDVFNHIIIKCIEQGLVTGESVVSDGTFIPANVSGDSKIEVTQTVLKAPFAIWTNWIKNCLSNMGIKYLYRQKKNNSIKKQNRSGMRLYPSGAEKRAGLSGANDSGYNKRNRDRGKLLSCQSEGKRHCIRTFKADKNGYRPNDRKPNP